MPESVAVIDKEALKEKLEKQAQERKNTREVGVSLAALRAVDTMKAEEESVGVEMKQFLSDDEREKLKDAFDTPVVLPATLYEGRFFIVYLPADEIVQNKFPLPAQAVVLEKETRVACAGFPTELEAQVFVWRMLKEADGPKLQAVKKAEDLQFWFWEVADRVFDEIKKWKLYEI